MDHKGICRGAQSGKALKTPAVVTPEGEGRPLGEERSNPAHDVSCNNTTVARDVCNQRRQLGMARYGSRHTLVPGGAIHVLLKVNS